MGKRDRNRKLKSINFYDPSSESDEENSITKFQNRFEPMEDDIDDEEANEDFSLKIIQKAMLRASNPEKDESLVADLKKSEKKEKKKRKKKKAAETEVADEAVSGEIDNGFKDFCGELFLVDNVKGDENIETDRAGEVSEKAVEVETNTPEVSDNVVLRKLLRGPRYFDPPDNNSWGACYNCGEEGHVTVNCTATRRKKPCFVCGSFEHNAKQCSKGRDCFICKQQGHRSKDCPEKNSSKMCLKCGDFGHDMFQCRNEYCPDDLKEIQCYVCHRFGHLCCMDYGSPSKKVLSCYKCGGSGHTGLACTRHYSEMSGSGALSSCYNCGGGGHFARECTSSVKSGDTNGSCYKCGGEGHFARECTSSKKTGKRNREQSTSKHRSSKKNRDQFEAGSAYQDLGKTRKHKKSQHDDLSQSGKAKHRGGWITEDPEYYYNSNRSPSTPSDRRSKIHSFNSDYASGSRSSSHHLKSGYSNNSTAYRSNGYHDNRYSTSRYGNNSNGGMGRNYEW